MHYDLDLEPIRPVGVVGVGAAGDAAGYDGHAWFIRRGGQQQSFGDFAEFIREFVACDWPIMISESE
jgi:hypothetical protein